MKKTAINAKEIQVDDNLEKQLFVDAYHLSNPREHRSHVMERVSYKEKPYAKIMLR